MKQLLVIAFTFFSMSVFSQTSFYNGAKNKQDSVNIFVKKRDVFLDSLVSKTSMKEFQLWLDESVSGKAMREGKLNELWSAFVSAKLDEWVRKNKITIPQN